MTTARKRLAPPRASMSEQESRAWQAATAVLDRVAADVERRWGVGRLETLVSPATAAKFAAAKQQCDEAITAGDVFGAAAKAASVVRGYAALEAEARAAGHTEAATGVVWCFGTDTRAYAVCLHTADLGAVAAKYPDHQAVSLPELIRLLEATEAGRLVAAIKDRWPGTGINQVTEKKLPPTKPPVDWKRGDEVPF